MKLLCDDRTGEISSIKAAQLLTSGFTKTKLGEPMCVHSACCRTKDRDYIKGLQECGSLLCFSSLESDGCCLQLLPQPIGFSISWPHPL